VDRSHPDPARDAPERARAGGCALRTARVQAPLRCRAATSKPRLKRPDGWS